MSIAFSKYISITSVVGATNGVQNRELIGRINTTNPLLPTGSIIEFTSADQVGEYFGISSDEYLRASTAYFNFISQKNLNTPQKLSFARWADVDTAPLIFGAQLVSTALTQFQVISNGAFSLTLGSTTHIIGGLNFTSALSLSDVASVIQAGINAETGLLWTGATVSYNNTRGGFDFVGGDVGANDIAVALAGSGTEILILMGWGGLTTILSDGADAQSITEFLTQSTNISNNFGSFIFAPVLTLNRIVEATVWNNLPENNNLYQYHVPVSLSNAPSYSTALIGYAGTSLEISETAGEYPEQAPMCVLATTNFASANAVQNYMYQQFDFLTPSVTDTVTSDGLDAVRVNYYGQTQNAGQKINFFQRGVLMGTSSDAIDMGVYANEQWLKDQAGVAIMSLFLQVGRVPANLQGEGQINAVLQDQVIKQALINGVISVGKPLNIQQKGFITQVTGDDTAWQIVQNNGYWLKVNITVTLEASYTLIYSKDDDIRQVQGLHVLI